MQNWHRQFLGRTQMPPTISGFVINEFFTLSQSELQAVLSRYGVDMRLGAALQIGFLKMCGRPLDKFQRVPFAVLEHLNAQVGGSPPDLATLRAFYSNAPRVLYRHQQIALDVLGLVRFEAEADSPRVLDAICDKVRAGVDADKLLTETRIILYERHFMLPAPRAVGELAKRARETVERDVAGAIERAIPPATRARWVEQLFESRAGGMPCIEFLQEPPGSLNPSSITREAEKVRTLLEMHIADIPDLPGTEKYWQMYAAKMRNQRPSRFDQRKEPGRSIELVGFLRHSLAAHTDTLIRMVDRRVSQLWGRASKKAKADQGALPALTVLLAGVREAINNQKQSLGWVLGILMCPRLKNFNDRRLHVPTGDEIRIPENLKEVVLPDISLKSIERGWAGHLKVADAVMSGRLSATTAIELQGAARDGDASFRAGHAHGLLLRTNDLLRAYTDPDYRREKLRYLNHNERTHQLQRQIRHAGSGSTRGKREDELGAQSHCLAMCTNLVMAYNTSHLQRTLDAWRRKSGREVAANLQRFISPMGFEHINFNGVIVFPFDHYRTQLFAPQWGVRGRRSGVVQPIRPSSTES